MIFKMETYSRKMYQFLSKEENLKGLIIAKEQFPLVKKQLTLDFWKEVKLILTNALANDPNWEVILEEGIINSNTSKLYVWDKGHLGKNAPNKLPDFMFCWERLSTSYPYFGFWVNTESIEFKSQEIINFLSEKKNILAEGYEDMAESFPFWWNDNELDFNSDNSLLLISAENRSKKAQEYADIVIELMDRMKEDYDKILNDEGFKR